MKRSGLTHTHQAPMDPGPSLLGIPTFLSPRPAWAGWCHKPLGGGSVKLKTGTWGTGWEHGFPSLAPIENRKVVTQ